MSFEVRFLESLAFVFFSTGGTNADGVAAFINSNELLCPI